MAEDSSTKKGSGYWAGRSESIYLYSVRQLVEGLGKDCKTMVDIGSAGCPYLDWFDWIPQKTSLDMARPYRGEGIKSVQADFMQWESNEVYDIGTCLQVLEHVPLAEEFAQKLLQRCKILVVSVPYKWKFGRNNTHVHDPVDEEKMRSWFGRRPNFSVMISEVKSDAPRLIQVYEQDWDKHWASLKQRERLRNVTSD
ncbi:methyltransferase domain-containing protein [Woodsholea maritima]|uniref:hypothetical protein n=1 Tax=Woodsholea maritima TaxID=240237 RepID=UPI00035F20F3|nr:hypothetical protein [Woodsholea maritima]